MASATVYIWWKTREAFLAGDVEGAELEVRIGNIMGYAGSRGLTLEELLFLGQFEEAGSDSNVDCGKFYDDDDADDEIKEYAKKSEEYACFSTSRLDEEKLIEAPTCPLIEGILKLMDEADFREGLVPVGYQ